jgi:enolase-phosphatase E1
LSIFPEDDPARGEHHELAETIADKLSEAGVRFERWGTVALDDTADVLAAYREPLARLKAERGFVEADVVGMTPDHPQREALRRKFLDEHTHSEDEARFFVEGSGVFYIHHDAQVYALRCERGDLINVPAGTRHWFDMGARPFFRCIRLFTDPKGWVAQWTGSPIGARFVRPLVPRAVLVDIEGTTTELSFVKEVLFPIARRGLAELVDGMGREPPYREALARLRASSEGGDVVAHLERLIDEDRKDSDLKLVQGAIWRRAYAEGLRAHVYPDVAPALARWQARGLRLAVFSSGSVEAQRLLFAHSVAGDLTPCFSAWFDTTTGPKRDPEAYRRIARALELEPGEVCFLSDVAAELDAARAAGMTVVLVARDGAHAGAVSRFDELDRLLFDEARP